MAFTGCNPSGKAVGNIGSEGNFFSVNRSIPFESSSPTTITLTIDHNYLFSDDEIIMIVETIPDNYEINPYSLSHKPAFLSDHVIIWTFTSGPPVEIGGLIIDEPLPKNINYGISDNSVSLSGFEGKWGFKILGYEGLIISVDVKDPNEMDDGDPGDDGVDENPPCSWNCPDEGESTNIFDLIYNWLNDFDALRDVFDVIELI